MGRFVAWTPEGRRGSDLGDGLTWELVDGATGASQSLQGRCFPRRAHRNSRGDPIVYKRGRSRTATIDEEDEIDDQEEEHLGSDNEEREQDEDDDANVTDNEDSPTNVAAETTNDAPTNEFDDGYWEMRSERWELRDFRLTACCFCALLILSYLMWSTRVWNCGLELLLIMSTRL